MHVVEALPKCIIMCNAIIMSQRGFTLNNYRVTTGIKKIQEFLMYEYYMRILFMYEI